MRVNDYATKGDIIMIRGEKVCAFIEQYCLIPEGAQVGQPIKLMKFQKQFILDVYDNPHGTSRAYLSVARKNAKSALIRHSPSGLRHDGKFADRGLCWSTKQPTGCPIHTELSL